MGQIKKFNVNDVNNLVEGTISEVKVYGEMVKVVSDEDSLMLCSRFKEMPVTANPDAINAAIVEYLDQRLGVFLVDCGDYYMTVEDYIEEMWSCGDFNFEIRLADGRTLYSTNCCDNEDLPIWDWHIGLDDGDYTVSIGDVRQTYVELFNEGNLIQEMVGKLFFTE